MSLGPAFQNAGVITNLTLSGSTLAGTNTLTGTLNWAGGAISGAFTITSTGVLNLSGAGQVVQYASLTNAGVILWNGSGNWEVYNDGAANKGLINNLSSGTILVQCNNSLTAANTPWFLNAGTFTKSVSPGLTSVSVPFTNTGTVSVQSGALTFGSGSFGGVFQTANGTPLDVLATAESWRIVFQRRLRCDHQFIRRDIFGIARRSISAAPALCR